MFWPFHRRRERDLDDEIQRHLEMAERDRIDRGELPDEARASARREFGNVALTKERTRDVWTRRWLSAISQDVHYGLRALRRSPGFTAAAVISLALGIGANTAIFAAVDALMLRPLPVPHPDELVQMIPSDGGQGVGMTVSYPEYLRYREALSGTVGLAGVFELERSTLRARGWNGDGSLGPMRTAIVTGNYFRVFGVEPRRGRLLAPEDEGAAGSHPTAVLSEALWRRLGGTDDIVGRTITVNSAVITIVGVVAAPFRGDHVESPVDVWFPTTMIDDIWPERPGLLTNPNPPWLRLFGRMDAGQSVPRAEAIATAAFRARAQAQGPPDPRMTAKEIEDAKALHMTWAPLGHGFSISRQTLRQPLTIVWAIAGLVLLIACANIANLLLARAEGRDREMAVRLALGAGTGRLVRQLLTESVLVAAVGGAIAIALGWWGTQILAATLASSAARAIVDVRLDWRLLAFAGGLSLLTGLLFGLVPAWRVARVTPASVLGRRSADGRRTRVFGVAHGLIVIQIGVSIVLVVGAGLFVQTLWHLKSRDLGFARDRTLMIKVSASETGGRGEPVARLFHDAPEAIAQIPGVVSVGPSTGGLLAGEYAGSPVTIAGHARTDDEDFFVQWNIVGPRFFNTVGTPLLAGRDVSEQDTAQSPRVAVINETMARYYWHSTDVVGQRFGMRRDTGNEIEIVGVVADQVTDTPREARHRMIYLPYRQEVSRMFDMWLAVRTAGDATAMTRPIREVLERIGSSAPITIVTTLDAQLDQALGDDRLIAELSLGFGIIALMLTCAGLYGVMAYLTAKRTNEIGIRMALGGSGRAMLGRVLLETLGLALAGVALGAPAAIAVGHVVSSRLVEIAPGDVRTVAAAGALLACVAVGAAWIPARRASRVDPMVALRSE